MRIQIHHTDSPSCKHFVGHDYQDKARYDKEYELFLAEFHRLHDSFETTIDKKFIKFGLEHIDFSIFKNKSMIL